MKLKTSPRTLVNYRDQDRQLLEKLCTFRFWNVIRFRTNTFDIQQSLTDGEAAPARLVFLAVAIFLLLLLAPAALA